MSADYLLSFGGWYFLPNLVTNWAQSIYYGLTIRAGDPHPAPNTPQWIRHRKNIYTLVVVSYLLFTIYQTDWNIRQHGDFYAAFGVPESADVETIKRVLRRAMARAHPDKAPAHAREEAERTFIAVKIAYDTLTDPARRFAYERLGPAMLDWKGCKAIGDFVAHGVRNSALTLGMTLIAMLIAQATGLQAQLSRGQFWRYLTLAALLVFELHTITRPSFPRLLTGVVNPLFAKTGVHPPLLPYQLITLARSTAFSLFIAVNQLVPTWANPAADSAQSQAVQNQLLAQVRAVLGGTAGDAQRLLALEHAPFAGDEAAESRMREALIEWLVQNEVRNEKGVANAIRRAMARRNGAEENEEER